MNLPQAYLKRIREQLGSEYEDFLASYADSPSYGLRINPLKGASDKIASELPFTLSPIPWAAHGYHADPAEHPGRHPLHEAGVYYIQDPSAMSVVSLLNPMPGERILDLCAAPGGKSTQIAGCMGGSGLLVSNEIIPGRAKILSQNIERMGITNAIVCNEDPGHLAEHFPLFFDRIVVDAPCSGEGMFRKDPAAVTEWSPDLVTMCAKRQETILSCADRMLKPGGILVYSTCTFAPAEDEDQICHFLQNHTEYTLEDWQEVLPDAERAIEAGIVSGTLPGTMRLWPHKAKGEGHFAARLRKSCSDTDRPNQTRQSGKKKRKQAGRQPETSDFLQWQQDSLCHPQTDLPKECLQYFGEELYRIPEGLPPLKGMRVLRAGLHLGTRKKNRFEPSLAYARSLTTQDVKSFYSCSYADAVRYLHGEVLHTDPIQQPSVSGIRGWTLLCCHQYPLGWTKASQGILKNHYPKGLRIPF